MQSRQRTNRLYASVLGVTLFSTTILTPIGAFATENETPVLQANSNFSVSQVPGGFEVSVDLDEPLQVRNEIPSIWVDGVDIGPAQESADGTRLVATTSLPIAATARDVSYGFESPTIASNVGGDGSGLDTSSLDVLDLDPSSTGDYAVDTFEYDFGSQAVDLAAIGGIKGEFRAEVYAPIDADTASPLVIFQHGRHTSCNGPGANPLRYPCGETQTEIPSYKGYAHTAEKLASHGYVVVSVSANAINSNDNQLASDYGATARGQLVLDHLDFLAEANAGAVEHVGDKLVNKIDFDNIGLMGHSRGGEGVARAVQLNQGLEEPYGIKTVLPLAPVDFSRLTTPGVSFMTVLPYCDGDVSNLQGQHMFDDNNELINDNALRSALLVEGANHNFFNTIWDPETYNLSVSDDWRDSLGSACSKTSEDTIRLTSPEQRQVGDSIMNGWFRLTLGGEEQFLPMFDGSNVTIEAYEGAKVVSTVSAPSQAKAPIASLAQPSRSVRGAGTFGLSYCATGIDCGADISTASARLPHWASMRFAGLATGAKVAEFSWTRTDSQIGSGSNFGELYFEVPATAANAAAFETVSFQMSPSFDKFETQELNLRLVDKDSKSAEVNLSEFTTANQALPAGHANLGKVILRQVSVPLDEFEGVDLTEIRQVVLVGTGARGDILIKDLAFQSSSLGDQIAVPELPVVGVSDLYVDEGDSNGRALVGVTLNKKATAAVSGHFEVFGGAAGGSVSKSEGSFTIPAGQQCVVQEVILSGDRKPSAAATTDFKMAISAISGGITGKNHAILTIREDDAVINADGVVLDLAPQVPVTSNPCAGLNFADSRIDADLRDETVVVGAPATVITAVKAATTDVVPSGTVTVSAGGEVIGSGVVDAKGKVRVSVPTSVVGTNVFTVRYDGDSAFNAAETLVELEVVKAKATVVGKLSKSTITVGQTTSIAVKTSAQSLTASGKITAKIGKVSVAATLKGGKATIAVPKSLSVGKHAVTVSYGGSTLLKSASVKVGTLTVKKATASVSGKLSKTSVKKGQSVNYTVTVKSSAGTPTGKVTVKVGGKSVSKTLKNGKATVALPKSIKAGKHRVSVKYSGNSKITAQTITSGTLTVK